MARRRDNSGQAMVPAVHPNENRGHVQRAQIVDMGEQPVELTSIESDVVETYDPQDGPVKSGPAEPAQPAIPSSQPAAPEATTQAPDDEVDDPRFKGKPPKEIYQSYKELERKLGEQGAEVARFRAFFDQHVREQATKNPPVESQEDEAAILNEMLGKPKQFIQKVKRDLLQEITGMQSRQEMEKVRETHKATTQDPGFQQWLVQNVPFQTAQMADYDPGTFGFIMNAWNYHKASQTARQQAADEATTRTRVVTNSAPLPPASKPATSEAVFTRRQLMEMMVNKPDEYKARQPEILRAYAEGRVK